MNMLLATYCDMILSTKTGNWKGQMSVSKFLYLMSIIEAIEYRYLLDNEISLENVFVRKSLGNYMNNNMIIKKDMKHNSIYAPFIILEAPSIII